MPKPPFTAPNPLGGKPFDLPTNTPLMVREGGTFYLSYTVRIGGLQPRFETFRNTLDHNQPPYVVEGLRKAAGKMRPGENIALLLDLIFRPEEPNGD